jgi:hypothetical protein
MNRCKRMQLIDEINSMFVIYKIKNILLKNILLK